MVRVNEAAKGRQGIAHMGDIEVAFVLDPRRKQMLVRDEVPDVAFDVVNCLGIVFRKVE